MSLEIFVPSHITGFFNISNNEDILKNGSCGAGLLLSKGVKTTIKKTHHDESTILINGKSNKNYEPIVNEVLKLLDIDYSLKISQEIQVPVGCGFGTSAGQALGVALAISKGDINKAGQIAHKAEVALSSGLGDVIAQTGRGLVLRVKEGAPGVGEIKSFIFDDVYIGCKSFDRIETSSVITDENYKKIITSSGIKALNSFKEDVSLENFFNLSLNFSKNTNLISSNLLKIVNELNDNPEIIGASMAMLGETVFAASFNKSTFPDDFDVYKLDNKGIVYD